MIMLNQPFNGQLGEILKDKMGAPYNKLTILSAFAKNSGVLRLKPALEQFKNSGGYIEAYIGVDAHGTSYEAVLNLFELCDELYIVHSESPVTTFHSKVYMLSNDNQDKWLAIGSNNLTGGGLWTNFESATYFDVTEETVSCATELDALITQFKDPAYGCSKRINSRADLDELLTEDYLRREMRIQIETRKESQRKPANTGTNPTRLFGTQQGIHIPRISQRPENPSQHIPATVTSQEISVVPSDDSEIMWFVTGSITGGSSNILDLSKQGKLHSGSAQGTRYSISDTNVIWGGVVFFDVAPNQTDIAKLVTINYEGVDYTGCEIKMHTSGKKPNGSWRLQLKGISSAGVALQNAEDGDWIAHKILIFEKIHTDYYVLSTLEEEQVDTLSERSRFVAKNSKTGTGRMYGLL